MNWTFGFSHKFRRTVVNCGVYVDRFRVLVHTQFLLLTPFLHTSDEELWLRDQLVSGFLRD